MRIVNNSLQEEIAARENLERRYGLDIALHLLNTILMPNLFQSQRAAHRARAFAGGECVGVGQT